MTEKTIGTQWVQKMVTVLDKVRLYTNLSNMCVAINITKSYFNLFDP